MHQLLERLGHFQRDNQQGHRESEHRIAEAFNARYFVTAPTELHAIADAPVDKFFSNHIGVARGYYRLVPVATRVHGGLCSSDSINRCSSGARVSLKPTRWLTSFP